MSGTKTIRSLYDKSIEYLKEISAFLFNLPKWIRLKIEEIKSHLALIRIKIKNFYATNLELGLYHLRLGNINDAIMRFMIIDRFIKPTDSAANYSLGWCYFFKNNYTKALKHLNLSREKNAKQFVDFINNCNSAQEVPEEIWQIRKDLTTRKELQKAGNYVANLPQDFIHELFNAMEELPKECAMLDLGCSGGFIGDAIDKKLQKNYHLTGVEDKEELLNNAKHLREDKRQVYDDLRQESINDFLSKNKIKYDVVTSFNSLIFAKNLESYFKQINKALKIKGYFALLLPACNEGGWNPLRSEFIYEEKEVIKQLKLAEFDIVSIKEWKLNRINHYIAYICKK